MSQFSQGLLSIDQLSDLEIMQVFQLARQFSERGIDQLEANSSLVVLQIFFEPSTRTRVSFEMAALRSGMKVIQVNVDSNTSKSKGESDAHTLANLQAMNPDIVVLRHGNFSEFLDAIDLNSIPTINAGDGSKGHPTQALLDGFTVLQEKGNLSGIKIGYMGDTKHSRVARSGGKLFSRLGSEVFTCGPGILTDETIGPKISKQEMLRTCDVIVKLRLQKERWQHSKEFSDTEFCLDLEDLATAKTDSLILHPGPFLLGEDFTEPALSYPGIRILKQVENGVYVRAALLQLIAKEKYKNG